MRTLTELQHDALTEIFNISIGRAAAAMGKIVQNEITLMVPSFDFLILGDAANILGKPSYERISAVSQKFNGPFSTEAILMFPEEKSLEIVRMMLGGDYPLSELSDLEQEAMSEVGNIILNACISTIANISGEQFSSSLPQFRLGNSHQILCNNHPTGCDEMVLFVHIDFLITRQSIHGYLAFLMSLPSIDGLIDMVDRFCACN